MSIKAIVLIAFCVYAGWWSHVIWADFSGRAVARIRAGYAKDVTLVACQVVMEMFPELEGQTNNCATVSERVAEMEKAR